MINITVKENDVDKRIDNFLCKRFPKLSLSSIYKNLRTKMIKVNNKKVNHNYRLQLNDKIEIFISNEFLSTLSSDNDFLLSPKNIDIVYEDKNILIVNKPVGLSVHEEKELKIDHLTNRVLHYLYDKKEWDKKNENIFKPSLVHRLDKNTNGLVIFAKNAQALKILNEKIKNHEIDKYYLATIHGILKEKSGTLKHYWSKNEEKNMVYVTNQPNKNTSVIITKYKVLSIDRKNNTSKIEVKLITGKTHQIRAHFFYIKHPLVGEKKYTTREYYSLDKNKWQDLSAYKIVFSFKSDAGILNYLKNKTFSLI